MELKILTTHEIDDFIALIRVFESVFEREKCLPERDHLSKLLKDEKFVVIIAKLNQEVIGGLTAYILDQYYSKKPLLYLYDLGVSQQMQRKGLGRSLITRLIEYGKENDVEEIYVQAEMADDHAIKFYRSTELNNELEAHHFSYSFIKKT